MEEGEKPFWNIQRFCSRNKSPLWLVNTLVWSELKHEQMIDHWITTIADKLRYISWYGELSMKKYTIKIKTYVSTKIKYQTSIWLENPMKKVNNFL